MPINILGHTINQWKKSMHDQNENKISRDSRIKYCNLLMSGKITTRL